MDEILTFDDAVEFLKISNRTLLRLLAEESIPARKVGAQWRFSRDALSKWIAEGDSKDYARGTTEESV